jgi:hypothetical protein
MVLLQNSTIQLCFGLHHGAFMLVVKELGNIVNSTLKVRRVKMDIFHITVEYIYRNVGYFTLKWVNLVI